MSDNPRFDEKTTIVLCSSASLDALYVVLRRATKKAATFGLDWHIVEGLKHHPEANLWTTILKLVPAETEE